jgi:hypothetical protein
LSILNDSPEPYTICFIIISAVVRLWFKQVRIIIVITRVRNGFRQVSY